MTHTDLLQHWQNQLKIKHHEIRTLKATLDLIKTPLYRSFDDDNFYLQSEYKRLHRDIHEIFKVIRMLEHHKDLE